MATTDELAGLEVQLRPDRNRVIVEVGGELDLASAGTLQEALDNLLEVGWQSIVLDLRALSFIDSTGLSLLLETDRACGRAGAAFAIVDGSPVVARLLELTGLEGRFARARVR
jgi:anti-sigma B factor antagonist